MFKFLLILKLIVIFVSHVLFLSVDPIPINEGTAEGVEVITVSASDLDTHPANTEIRYSIVSGNNDVSIIILYTYKFFLMQYSSTTVGTANLEIAVRVC